MVGVLSITKTYKLPRRNQWWLSDDYSWLGLDKNVLKCCGGIRKDVDNFEGVQRRAVCMIKGLKHISYNERLQQVHLLSLSKQTLKGNLTTVPEQVLMTRTTFWNQLFSLATGKNQWMETNKFKLIMKQVLNTHVLIQKNAWKPS